MASAERAQALLAAAQQTPIKKGKAGYRSRWSDWHLAIEWRLGNGETAENVVEWMLRQKEKEDASWVRPAKRKGQWFNFYRVVLTVRKRMLAAATAPAPE